jgi:hypothetical protein
VSEREINEVEEAMNGRSRGSFDGCKALAALAGAIAALLPQGAHACERCFGVAAESATTYGISMAMLSLLVVTGVVWGGIGMFFINMWRRAKLLEPGTHVVTERGHLLPSAGEELS